MSTSELIEEFLGSPLIFWLESCLPRPEQLTGYHSLLDGHLIHSVWLQIDPEPNHHMSKIIEEEGASLANARSRNIDAIVRNIKSLYEDELCQTVLILPDCFVMGQNPESKAGLEQMKLLLTLLLGAAVQCPNKELFIARIKEMDVDIQHGIVEAIRQVTDSQTLVLTHEFIDCVAPQKMIDHIIRLAKERDKYHSNWIGSLNSDSETINVAQNHKGSINSSNVTSPTVSSSSVSTTECNHLAVELADLKSKMRKIRQELEEKSEGLMESKEELEHTRHHYEKLKLESQEWYSEARQAATYRDEVDVLREKAERVERLEIEIQRFREKLSDVEFYKTRVEELREDNRMLLETKEMLEEQLIHSRKRAEQVMSLESEIIKYKQKLNDLAMERDADKTKMQELVDENTQLQLTTKNLISGSEQHAKSDTDEDIPSGDNSLSEQLTNNAQTRALKLELENRRLLAALDSFKETSFRESSQKILELEKEKKKLQLKCDQLQDNCDRMNQQNTELENVFKNALTENKKLQDIIDSKQQQIEKSSQDRDLDRIKIQDMENQIESLNKEKERVQNLSDSIQRRANDLEKTLTTKTKDFDALRERTSEFETFKKELNEIRSKLGFVEKENITLSKELVKTKENLENKELQVDQNNEILKKQEKELKQLNKELEVGQQHFIRIQDLEKKNQELISQNKIDIDTIKTLQSQMVTDTIVAKKFQQNLEKIGIDKSELDKNELNVEFLVDKLVKNPESFKTVREIMLNYNREISSSDICVLCHQKEIYTVEKDIQFTRIDEQEDVAGKVREQLEHLQTDFIAIQEANEALQAENAKKKVEVSTMGSQISSLNNQQIALQLANSQLASEKDCMVKKLEGMRMQHDTVLQDQVTLQCLHEQLSSEYDALNKEKEILKTMIRDLKLDVRNLRELRTTDEKTIEELKAELDALKKGSVSLNNLRAEHSKLKDDFRNLFTTSERLKHEYKNIQDQYRIIRAENSRLNIQTTEQSGEINNRSDHMTALEIDLTKSKQQCEMLLQMNQSLDTDRRTLMDHVSQLLSQYHELLTHSLEDKQHYHTEEKMFTDKVNDLKRQKEKLEEKIMEHYRKLDNCSPKKKPLVSNIVKKVRKAGTDVMNRVSSKNRRSWVEDPRLTQSQFILGSESGGNESDNSLEEPSSVVSDNTHLNRSSPARTSFQRKTSEQIQNVLMRGGVRGSLQQVSKRTEENQANRNSFQGFESPPDVTSTALGAAGSRRTVYLGEENKPDDETTATTNNGTAEASPGNAPVFLMYNKISTTIESPAASSASANGTNGNENPKTKGDKKKGDSKSRESAIWYEYGCV